MRSPGDAVARNRKKDPVVRGDPLSRQSSQKMRGSNGRAKGRFNAIVAVDRNTESQQGKGETAEKDVCSPQTREGLDV